MDRELEGKSAIITGGAKGIGRAAAECFIREGAKVLCMDWDAQPVPDGCISIRGDISRIADCERAVAEAVERFGGIDVLVNNAGIQSYGDAVTTTEDVWDRTMNVNLKGQWLMSRAAIP